MPDHFDSLSEGEEFGADCPERLLDVQSESLNLLSNFRNEITADPVGNAINSEQSEARSALNNYLQAIRLIFWPVLHKVPVVRKVHYWHEK